ncbi:fumarylacetoacetate hydrolase family protein [Marivita sp. XM-24bin2]|jgi:2-keto-4-pentenoate hydratase/2-oxohepta-3-ene-1,7-dioic acid hydratase in catechol pathway|uniref:fumarylacetoacetate hydrolase family protein n=1 Tax=unclassified Marivita TaxID=2632480 RepID=UPI000D7945AA|nr:fumarylacetoacetate hydrolase family protein [Marivita sp. XM-24bin2]MCR9109955.1 fumarylacetoacetate hydrolase family protein [Paracoccaceae bacterium]PWL35640.1 MAG: 2-hydroxyhepta-2,4-diene-1,7-dioate isomerase [Marivita sp. XM-24bin2]
MKWARGLAADGATLTGVIDAEVFHPRVGLGADTSAGDPIPLADIKLLPPVVPGKFIGLWNNFKAAAEKGGHSHPEHPLYFFKSDTSLSGHGATVELPISAGRVVFEGELGIVIGKTCKAASPEEAEQAIFGYTCINDLTSLDILNADPSFPQWTRSKSFDGFGVVGPVIETDLNWHDETVTVRVNGRERQSYPASDMILPPAKIVSLLSQDMTLNPGDLIACGTSLGARPVKAGMEVEVVIEGIGRVSTTLAAPSEI